jgi:hypothetical protein
MAVPPHEHLQCPGEVMGSCGSGVVSSGGMFGSTQCISQEKFLKVFQESLKIGQVI